MYVLAVAGRATLHRACVRVCARARVCVCVHARVCVRARVCVYRFKERKGEGECEGEVHSSTGEWCCTCFELVNR